MTSTFVRFSARLLAPALALFGGAVLWASALFVGLPVGPLWACLLALAAGILLSLWAVECGHRIKMATSEGQLENLVDRVQALCEFAVGLGLEDVREIVVKPADYDLVVEAAIAEGLVQRPPFLIETWRPETIEVHGIVCRRGHELLGDEVQDDSEISGC